MESVLSWGDDSRLVFAKKWVGRGDRGTGGWDSAAEREGATDAKTCTDNAGAGESKEPTTGEATGFICRHCSSFE
jgi:hypothetical protein